MEHSDENIKFWMACENYKKIDSRWSRISRAKKLYKIYIQPQSPREVTMCENDGKGDLLQSSWASPLWMKYAHVLGSLTPLVLIMLIMLKINQAQLTWQILFYLNLTVFFSVPLHEYD